MYYAKPFLYTVHFTISAAADATDIPPTPSVTLMDSSRVIGIVGGQVNIHQANIYCQGQGIPQGWYNPLSYMIE